MTNLETRVRETLTDRASAAGAWRVSGSDLRGAAADRASSRRRTVAVTAAGALAVAVVAGIATWPGGGPRDVTPTGPTQSPSQTDSSGPPPQPEVAWLEVPLPNAMFDRAIKAAGVNSLWSPLVSAHPLGGDDVVVLLSSIPPGATPPAGGFSVVSVSFASDQPDAAVRSGVLADYESWSDVIAQPVPVSGMEWDAVLVVLLPDDPAIRREVTKVTPVTDTVGGETMAASASVKDGIAFAPMLRGRPEKLTQLVFSGPDGVSYKALPTGSPLGGESSAPVPVVVASAGDGTPQVVQVRTNGQRACRMTLGSWWDGPPQIAWNAFDTACDEIDGKLHLLLAADRHYSSVAGLAPSGTSTVRLLWRDGATTEVDVTDPEVHAFLDSSRRRPGRLLRAEAVDAAGDVIASEEPRRP